jgi:hypothetical protein
MSTGVVEEGHVHRVRHVGGENGQTAIGFHALKQVADLDVGVSVAAVAYLRAFAEEYVGLVEQQNDAATLGGVEDAAKVLLSLADVPANDGAEIDQLEVNVQFAGEHLGGHRLTCAAIAVNPPANVANPSWDNRRIIDPNSGA